MYSVVEYHAEHERYRCGYCKRPDTNFSHGMWAHVLTVTDYQDLIDRGWRRSGKYCYKPTMNVTCCPMYTIRCKVADFHPTKSQKKLIKRVNRFLSQNDQIELKNDDASKATVSVSESSDETHDHASCDVDMLIAGSSKSKTDIDVNKISSKGLSKSVSSEDVKKSDNNGMQTSFVKENKVKPGVGQDPNRSPAKKAKLLRIQRKQDKLRSKGIDPSTVGKPKNNIGDKSIEEFLNDLPGEYKNKLKIKLVRTSPPSPEWEATKLISHEIYKRYQTRIHGDSEARCSMEQFSGFLVNSPLKHEVSSNGPECGYGSFHQQYWLNDNLIAVGVIDILPRCVSSVYFFYDPAYTQLTLGTYGALREITFARQLHEKVPSIAHYYMGFYIHSCQKMRYKGNYRPSYLLCPETYDWVPIEDARNILDRTPYARLNPDADASDCNSCTQSELDDVLLLVGHTVIRYKFIKTGSASSSVDMNKISAGVNEANLLEYAQLAGRECAYRMLLVADG